MMMMTTVTADASVLPLSDVSTNDSESASSFDQGAASGSDASSDASSFDNDEDQELSEFLWHAFVAGPDETQALAGHPSPPHAQAFDGGVPRDDGDAFLFPMMFHPDPELDALCL
jgi:hypothetical protein